MANRISPAATRRYAFCGGAGKTVFVSPMFSPSCGGTASGACGCENVLVDGGSLKGDSACTVSPSKKPVP